MSLLDAVVTVAVGGVQKEKFIINLPNIRNLRGFLKGEWNLADYDKCFPKRNRLGDVDGSVELNGHTLHIEFKKSKYAMTKGQLLKAINQAEFSNIVTIFVFGETNEPVEYLKITPDDLQPDYIACDLEGLQAVFKEWADYTEANTLVSDRTARWGLTDKYFGGK